MQEKKRNLSSTNCNGLEILEFLGNRFMSDCLIWIMCIVVLDIIQKKINSSETCHNKSMSDLFYLCFPAV